MLKMMFQLIRMQKFIKQDQDKAKHMMNNTIIY